MKTWKRTHVDDTGTILNFQWKFQNLSPLRRSNRSTNVKRCYLIALISAAAGSHLKWSETKSRKIRTAKDRHGNSPLLKKYKPLSNGFLKSSRLHSRLPLGMGTGALPARGTRRLVTIPLPFRYGSWSPLQSLCHHLRNKTRQPQHNLSNYHEITTVPNSVKCNLNLATNLMRKPWQESVEHWAPQLGMLHAQLQTCFRIHTERWRKQPKGKQHTPRYIWTLKLNSPMKPSSCINAHCTVTYGIFGWPL